MHHGIGYYIYNNTEEKQRQEKKDIKINTQSVNQYAIAARYAVRRMHTKAIAFVCVRGEAAARCEGVLASIDNSDII